MVHPRVFDVHRRWEDYCGIVLGALVALSPWLAGQSDNQVVLWVTIAVGLWIMQFAGLELVDLERSEQICLLILGLWLVVSPFALGYADSGALMIWHFVLGVAVALLAALELWQDRNLGDRELVRHGL